MWVRIPPGAPLQRKEHDINWKDHVYYDETSPTCLRWSNDLYRGKHFNIRYKLKGDVAGNTGRGQSFLSVKGKMTLIHRVVWEMHNGPITDEALVVDHINGDNKDHKISNLRLVSLKVNAQNTRLKSHNTSGACGVHYRELISGNNIYEYWVASWVDSGKYVKRSFSVRKLGYAKARDAAENCRKEEIIKLNLSGESYSERHGRS